MRVNLDNDEVKATFEDYGYNLNVFDPAYTAPVKGGESVEGNVGDLTIIKLETLVNGERITNFYIRDKGGKNVLGTQLFESKAEAIKAAEEYLEKRGEYDSYDFGGVTLSKGTTIKLKSDQLL